MSDPQSHVLSLFLKFSCAASISGRHEKNWDDFREVMISGLIWRSLWSRDHFGSYIFLTNPGRSINGVYPFLMKLWFVVHAPAVSPAVNRERLLLAAFLCYFHCFIFQCVRITYLMIFQFILCSIFYQRDLRLLSKNERVGNLPRISESDIYEILGFLKFSQ